MRPRLCAIFVAVAFPAAAQVESVPQGPVDGRADAGAWESGIRSESTSQALKIVYSAKVLLEDGAPVAGLQVIPDSSAVCRIDFYRGGTITLRVAGGLEPQRENPPSRLPFRPRGTHRWQGDRPQAAR